MAERANPNEPGLLRAGSAIFLGLMLIGGVAPIIAQMVDWPFLPSQSWFEQSATFAYGLAAAAFLVAWPLLFVKWAGDLDPSRKWGSGPVGRFFLSTFGAIMLAWATAATVIATCPMVLALVSGNEVVLRYEVADATRSSAGRRCGSPVVLRGMPIGLSAVCNVPEKVRSTLRPGVPIELEGWGTSKGLFLRNLRIARSNQVLLVTPPMVALA